MKIYENYFNDTMLLSPSINDYLNLSKYNYLKNKLENTLSKSFINDQKELHSNYLQKLIKKKHPTIYDKTLIYICNETLEYYKYNFDLIPINHQDNIIYDILEMANGDGLYIFSKKKDYTYFIEKIGIFNEIIESIISNMQLGIKKKYTLPKILTIKLVEQLKELLKTKSYKNYKIKYKLSFDFNKECEKIFTPPIKKLLEFLEKDYLSHSRDTIGMLKLPNGFREYKYRVKCSTTLKDIKVEDIHNYGLNEVERIYNLMIKIKNNMEFKGTFKEFNKYLGNRRNLKFKSKKDVIDNYKETLSTINKTIMKTQFHSNVKGKCTIIPVPDYNEDFSAEAYYIPGDIENKRQGKFYMNLRNVKELNKIEVESLTLHEANPGHHYQITYVNEHDNIPLFLKSYSNDAYQEGWALYCEGLGKYKTYESYYGKLILEMIRALRLVVDTGIHFYGWDYEKTFKFYKRFSFDSDDKIKQQLYRYIAIPGQALSYKIGEKIILDLKTKFKKYNKDVGSYKDFHERILEHGPIPFELLQTLI
jgi:uncharacterized protein (DUF885 family)